MSGYAFKVTDRGKRLAEAVRVARAAGGEGRWIAARLSDGGTDGAVYDDRAAAVRHQLHETQCAYLKVPPAPMPDHEASGWLDLNERAYDAGMRLEDPAGPQPMLTGHSTMIMPGGGKSRTANNRAQRRMEERIMRRGR